MPGLVKYGLGAGLVMSAMFFVPLVLGGPSPERMAQGEIVGYATMLLAMTATWFAMREDRRARGGTTFGRAFAVGIGVSVVAAALFGVATWAAYTAVGDALPDALITYYRANIEQSGAPPAEIEARLQEMEQLRWVFYNRPLQGLVMFATVFPIGVLESLVAAYLVSRSA